MNSDSSCRIFSQTFSVRCYERDLKGRLRLYEIFNWFQEAASNHCRLNKVALEDIVPKGYTWVIHRYKISVAKMPEYGGEYKISTWAQPKRDLVSIREFTLESPSGERLVSSTTEWALLDLKSKRPARLSSVMPDWPACDLRALDETLKPIIMPDGLPRLKTTEHQATAWCLDKNDHVNNSVYIAWAYDNLYPEIAAQHRLRELEINYRKQVFLGQTVQCRLFGSGEGTYYQTLTLKDTAEPAASVKSVWTAEV